MSIAIRIQGSDEPISHYSTFDHLGREIKLVGYQGGIQTFGGAPLTDNSLAAIIKDTGIIEADAPNIARPFHGEFGDREGRTDRREKN